MAGRNYLPPKALKLGEVPFTRAPHPALIDDPRVVHRVPVHPPPTAALAEERIAAQHREIQSLLIDNQRLAATHVALKQEFSAAQQELRHLSAAAADVKAERNAQVRAVHERSLQMEAEVRSIDALSAELAHVRADVQKLTASRQELTVKLKAIDDDRVRALSESKQFPAIKADIETMHQEIERGRAAIEYEKKVHASNLEQGQAMEKSMISMAREIEKLRAELANAEKRARAAAAAAAAATPSGAGYAAGYGNHEMGYGVNLCGDPYAMHQVQGNADAPRYDSATTTHGPYDIQQIHAHR
ncbi:Protein FLX-like [Actinidia chinensis var. chinensis]|uniref:Protein FLX-like n=1 Tax=Actinidia chinensis var. chinensis TaxID=1590841 RepID=A0A2R6QSV0_ACTCC|nr:Protein FLX-like [Actinidia chinensis var. chinensis]